MLYHRDPLTTVGPRHSLDWYDQADEPAPLQVGQRLLVPCVGGPSFSRLEQFPPRLELPDDFGTYVLVDHGRRDTWRYVFKPNE